MAQKYRVKRNGKTRVVQPSRNRGGQNTHYYGGSGNISAGWYPFDMGGYAFVETVTSSNARCSTDERGYTPSDADNSGSTSGGGYSSGGGSAASCGGGGGSTSSCSSGGGSSSSCGGGSSCGSAG